MKNFHTEETEKLYRAILSLKDIDECRNFFEDICTLKELHDISQRLTVAELLRDGSSYLEVSHTTGASTATISRVNKCLIYGNGGYETVIKRLSEDA